MTNTNRKRDAQPLTHGMRVIDVVKRDDRDPNVALVRVKMDVATWVRLNVGVPTVDVPTGNGHGVFPIKQGV